MFAGEEFAAFGDEALLGGGGEVECGFGAGWELGVDDGVGVAKLLVPLGVAEGLPVFGCDPVVARRVGSGVEAVEFA